MKNPIIIATLSLLCLQTVVCSEQDTCPKNTEYLNKLLDAESLILQRCNSTPKGLCPSESSTTQACDYINNYLLRLCLAQSETPIHHSMIGDIHHVEEVEAFDLAEENMKQVIRTILDDQPDKVKWQEFSKVKQASQKAEEIGEAYRHTQEEKF